MDSKTQETQFLEKKMIKVSFMTKLRIDSY